MGTAFGTHMRELDAWSFGPLTLLSCELNPKSGPANVCVGTETTTGERWVARVADVEDWEPSPHKETLFALVLLSPDDFVLFEAVCNTREKLERLAAMVRRGLDPLNRLVEPDPSARETLEEHTEDQETEEYESDGSEDGAKKDDEEQAFQTLKQEWAKHENEPLFDLGQVVSTPGALGVLNDVDIAAALYSHVRGDWGDVCREDWEENDLSLREGFRLLSVYYSSRGTKFWVITEGDRSVTTLLLPEEY